MTAADQLEIYQRMRQLGAQVAHGTYTRHDASRSAYYLSHTLAHHLPSQTQAEHLAFLLHLIDQAATAEHHHIALAEVRARRAVRPLLDLDRPSPQVKRAAIEAAAGQLTADEIELVLAEEVAWLNRRRRQNRPRMLRRAG